VFINPWIKLFFLKTQLEVKLKKISFLVFVLLAIIFAIVAYKLFINKGFFKKNQRTEIEIYERDLDIKYGSDTADLTIFLYSSYNCSFCRKFFTKVYPALKTEYIDKGKVKLVVKLLDFSNNESVENSLKLAVCINKYGNFEKLNELLIAEPKVIYTDEFASIIDEFIEKDEFVAECMLGGESNNYILKNRIDFKNLNLTGTPTFVINNNIYKGYIKYNDFKNVIEKELEYIKL
jgi:protein-disulfide isomerase